MKQQILQAPCQYISSFDEFYLYQECGTPIDENTVDPSQRQWAYVKWVREGFDSLKYL